MNLSTGGATLLDRWEALGRPLTHLPRRAAVLMLALLGAAMAWAAAIQSPAESPAPRAAISAPQSASADRPPKGDMALYARIGARVAAGEGYYSAALGEQRASGYPTRPFVTVRLPTLAWLQALLGPVGLRLASLGLVAGCLWGLWHRRDAIGHGAERLAASLLLLLGGGAALSPVAVYDHDFIAGLLLSLAMLSYRPDRWWPALLAVAAALAVRELAAPFAVLWLAFALAGRRWREAVAIAALLTALALGLMCHAAAIEAARAPGDLTSQGWSAMAGYGLALSGVSDLTGLRFMPPGVAASLAILPLLGWAAPGGRLGLFALLWFTGLATMIALFARPENFYWVELALPAYGIGLAFAPRALYELVLRAFVRN
ncbi:hypothetical protein [Porphyrobacter sp. YT40]|uniref:hypothetical protein n=1 Tax=Porphyrobacter sp. YT40 TaxID=2547601 RepID=UPI001141BEF2|nr:hypothetical protein [Porphyrobacter sp. YT40]QDH35978.1 hypothetical protein E2E27_17645 [Porphyrobacter sp. YT40]